MPSFSDEANQQLMNEVERKVAEKSADVASDLASEVAARHRSNDFSMFNNNHAQLEFREYFQEGERREVFGDIVREEKGLPPRKPPAPPVYGPPPPPVYGPPPPPDDYIYERYDSLAEKAQPKIDKLEEKKEANKEKLERLRGDTAKTIREIPHKKGRLTYEKGKSRTDESGKEVKSKGRLTFKDEGRMTEREHYKMLHKKDVADRKLVRSIDKTKQRTKRLVDDENIAEDENAAAVSGRLKTAKKGARLIVRENVKKIRHTANPYSRLKVDLAKEQARLAKDYALKGGKAKIKNDTLTRAGDSAAMKKKLKRNIARRRAAEQGNLFTRMKRVMFGWKKRAAVHMMTVKRNVTLITSLGSIVSVVLLGLLVGFMILFLFLNTFAAVGVNSTTSNTYDDISAATAEFRRLEVDMEEFLDPETLEPFLQEENPDKEIYEFIYDLDEFGFSPNTLIAYLSVKFQEFDLQEVEAEIQSIFDEMYYFHYELIEEPRHLKVGSHYDEETGATVDDYEWVDVWICYVYLEKTEMETVVERRMTAEELEQYQAYKLSNGGQQVYGAIMLEDWTDLISSPYGERIHPITGARTFHNGVDIAIPTGTKLYTPVEGKVTTATYSDTAGNYLIVTTEDGWSVKFMHMDSLAVSRGDMIEKGDFVGYSGNTGRSTGPHLHLEIRNPEDLPMDPVFIVPQSVAPRTN